MLQGLLLFLGTSAGSVWMYLRRRTAAERETAKFLERAGLPFEPELIAATQARFEQRQQAFALGSVAGSIPGTAAFIWLDAGPTALAWWAAFLVAGIGLGVCALYGAVVRAGRADGPRTAALRQRRLVDFLSPTQVVLQYGFLLLPAITAVLGIRILIDGNRTGWGWGLIAAAVGAVLLVVGAAALQRWVIQVNQPAGQVVELRWGEAMRSVMLRDLAAVMVGASWALGGCTVMFAVTDRPDDFPAFMEPVAYSVFLVSTLVFIWMSGAASTGRTLRRSQQVIQ